MTADISSTGTYAPDSSAPQKASPTPTAVDKNMFLQLMVAQLRNQDPLNPSDGTQFVAQLAQFQQMEQTLNMSQDIAAIRESLNQIQQAGTIDSIQTTKGDT